MTTQKHFKPAETLQRLNPADLGLKYTSAQRLEINAETTIASGAEELCLVCIAGNLRYTFAGQAGEASVCDMIYLPINSEIAVAGEGVLMRFGAPCDRPTAFAFISFKDVDADSRHKVYGKAEQGTLRDVWNYIDESFDSSRMLVGICHGRDGGWTAWPPHEHARQREETYVYFNMGDSFGIQCVYDELEEPYNVELIREGHLISIPRGYHPNCGCPCGGIFYVYCMVSTTAEDRSFMDLATQKIYGDKLE